MKKLQRCTDYIRCDKYDFDTSADELKGVIDKVVIEAQSKGMIEETGRFDFNWDDDLYDSKVYYHFDRLETDDERKKRESLDRKIKERLMKQRENQKKAKRTR